MHQKKHEQCKILSKNGPCTLSVKYAYSVLIISICAAMLIFFVTDALGGIYVVHANPINCNVKTFGAVGNGTTKDTAAIQKAIDFCGSKGGGIVEVPSGTYLSAPLYLKSNITLQVDAGATLDASKTLSDFTIPPGVTVQEPVLAFINGYKINNVGITGDGVINGEGSVWWKTGKAARQRPRLIELAYTTGVTVTGIHLENGGSMHLFFFGSSKISVSKVTITAPATSPNTDGIDFSFAHDGVVNGCNIDTGDDNIAIVSGIGESTAPNLGASNITIENCQFKHGHGLSIGSGITGNIHHIKASTITFDGTTNGLRIKSNTTVGGELSDVSYSNIMMSNVKHPLLFTAFYSSSSSSNSQTQSTTDTIPYYHDITVTNMKATNAGDGGSIIGAAEKPFTAITLDGVNISSKKALIVKNATVTLNGKVITG